jgi:FSR family fosmidomycin resistance protein-like MFS transporter
MNSAVFRLVFLISCCHALVHVFEQSLSSVEQLIGQEFSVGPDATGGLGTVWRIPFGAAAFFAGWLTDRVGCRRMLIVYLVGCSATAAILNAVVGLPAVFLVMFFMGLFASIYHPAGLALISHETEPENRGRALGLHGILGSVGIAGAPLLAAAYFAFAGTSWRHYYLFLAAIGLLAAVLARLLLPERRYGHIESTPGGSGQPQERGRWAAFGLLVTVGTMFGLIYAAFTYFLPRYLDSAGVLPTSISPATRRTLLSGGVLLCGAFGQWFAGRVVTPRTLHRMFVWVLLGNAPCLLWMALAEGPSRVWATACTAVMHFMHQPIYNSLVAVYVPRHRRSAGYGFSNMMCFGLGALGPLYAGAVGSDLICYASLAGLAVIAAALGTILWRHEPP